MRGSGSLRSIIFLENKHASLPMNEHIILSENKHLIAIISRHVLRCLLMLRWAHIIAVVSHSRVPISVISTISTFLLSSLLASCRVIGTRADILVYSAGALFNQAINLISLVAETKRFIGAPVAVIAPPVICSPLPWHRKLPLSSLSRACSHSSHYPMVLSISVCGGVKNFNTL